MDKELRSEIANKLKKQGFPVASAEKLASWDPFDQNAFSSFFDPEWMFDIKNGFDIVIGNPPYVQLQKDGGKLAKLYQPYKYETFEKTGDLYSLFYEKGTSLLNEKGFLCYITSNKWMRANYGASTRHFFAQKTFPLLLIDFGNVQVFDTATVDTNILILQNKPKAKKHDTKETFAVRINNDFNLDDQQLQEYVTKNGYTLSSLGHNSWVVGERDIYDIKDFVERQGIPLWQWNVIINYGIKSGTQDAFMVPEKIKDQLIKDDPNCSVLLKKLLRGKDISSWYPEFSDYWLIGTFPSLNIEIDEYPSIKKHLLSFGKEKLEQDGLGRKKTGNKWFETQDQISYWRNFELPKLIYPEITKYIPFVYDESEHFYTNNKCFILSGEKLKYLTCILNSKLFKYCFLDNFPELQGGSRELRKVFFEKIPIKRITDENEIPFAKLVDYLIAFKKEKSTEPTDQMIFIYFEQVANALVFEFYFTEEFEYAKLAVAKHLAQLPNLNTTERIIVQLRKIYVMLNKDESPVKQSVSSMLSIPQINLINNSISW